MSAGHFDVHSIGVATETRQFQFSGLPPLNHPGPVRETCCEPAQVRRRLEVRIKLPRELKRLCLPNRLLEHGRVVAKGTVASLMCRTVKGA
jgi:hypothetical protein